MIYTKTTSNKIKMFKFNVMCLNTKQIDILKKSLYRTCRNNRHLLIDKISVFILFIVSVGFSSQNLSKNVQGEKQLFSEVIHGYIIKKKNLKKGNYILNSKKEFDKYVYGIFDPVKNKPATEINFKKESVVILYLGVYKRIDSVSIKDLYNHNSRYYLSYKIKQGKKISWESHNYKLIRVNKLVAKKLDYKIVE